MERLRPLALLSPERLQQLWPHVRIDSILAAAAWTSAQAPANAEEERRLFHEFLTTPVHCQATMCHMSS